MSHKHITSSQRNELSILLRTKTKQKEIAKLLKKDRTTIWRERKRVELKSGKYYAKKAKADVQVKQIEAHKKKRKIENNPWLKKFIEKKIGKRWSPEQISGRLKKKYPNDKSKHVGKDTIYKYIHTYRKDLVKFLRCQKGKYRRRYGTRIREKQREEGKKKRIDMRPKIVDEKGRIGDWEGDTIVGDDKKHILTHTERRSGILFADKLGRGTANATKEKTIARFSKLPKKKKCTITYDNGVTFSDHELTERETGMTIYFAYPYHSWERGCNENSNGLLRQYFPKKTPLGNVTQERIDYAVDEINGRPRKRLDYLTPYEVFYGKNIKF
jgi:IS30 family transposase